MTIKTAMRRHRELWGWLALTGGKYKRYWPKWKENGGKYPEVIKLCFACKMAGEGGGHCDDCPIEWPGGKCENDDYSGLYEEWCYTQSKARRKELAAQIRDLPWKVQP